MCAKRYFKNEAKHKTYSEDELSISDYEETHVIDINNTDEILEAFDKSECTKGLRSKLRTLIFNVSKVPCNWRFDTLSINRNELIARCTCKNQNCDARATLTTESDQQKLRISINSYNAHVFHNSKSHTTGAHKKNIMSILRKEKPHVTRALLANEMLNDNDPEPAILPTVSTLNKQKSRFNKKNADNLHEDPIIAISRMKSNAFYMDTIYNIGLNPFFVLYATPTQKALMQSENRRNKCILAIDATGLSVKLSKYTSISSKTGSPKRVFLYAITALIPNSTSMPVYQMISQEHSSIQINLMLSKFKADIITHKNPNEITMDQSAALLLSSVSTFTSSTSVNQYLDNCYDALFENKPSPECYIRLDRSHVVKFIQQKKSFRKGISKETATLYKRLLGYIIQLEDITEASGLIYNMFMLMHCRYLYQNDNLNIINIKSSLVTVANQHQITDNMEITYHLPDHSIFEGKYH